MESAIGEKISNKVTYTVFIFSLILVVINIISVIFPSLIAETLVKTEVTHGPFTIGSWAIPVIIANLVCLGIGIAYFKNYLPRKIANTIRFVYNFEVSKQVAIIVLIILIFYYIGSTLAETAIDEIIEFGDFRFVKEVVDRFPEREGGRLSSLEILVVKNSLLKSSLILFDNIRVIPVIASTALLLVTYFFTYEITKKRFAGILSIIVLLQSFTFLRYDSASTYANFWTLFYLLSLYLIMKKKWYLSPISYIASIFSKPLSVAYLPMTLFFTYRANISRKLKFKTLIVYAALVIIGIYVFFGIGIDVGGSITTKPINFDYVDFVSAFTIWAFQLRFETMFLTIILPLTVCLFLVSKKVNPQADSILFLITGIIFAMPLLAGFSDFNLHPYRFVPLMVFFAIGVGTLFSKKTIAT